MPDYADFTIVCGLSPTDAAGDWQHLGLPVRAEEIWELSFLCCHKTDAPDAEVVGSLVVYNRNGQYQETVSPKEPPLIDSTAWQRLTFTPPEFTINAYVFPAIWWHTAGPGTQPPLKARYLASVQFARITSDGSNVAVAEPDIFLTLTNPPSDKLLGSDKVLGPPREVS